MPRKRKSYHLSRLQSELRKQALHTEDEELRSKFWRLFYKARNAEHEIREMVMDAEMRRLLDFVFPNGIPSDLVDDVPVKMRRMTMLLRTMMIPRNNAASGINSPLSTQK